MSEAEKEKQSFDFEAHRRTAIDEYRKQRNSYEQFAEEVRNILIEAINGRGIRISDIQFRAKTLDSFGKKAITPSETARQGSLNMRML